MKSSNSVSFSKGLFYRILFIALINCTLVSYLTSQNNLFRLAPLFQDNMVLQQQADVTVWGKGDPGSTVAIQTSGERKRTPLCRTTAIGRPKYRLKSGRSFPNDFPAWKQYDGRSNILIGEVWLCSGQSNMEMPWKAGRRPILSRTVPVKLNMHCIRP